MVLVENVNIIPTTPGDPIYVSFDIELPDVPSSRDWYVQYKNPYLEPVGTDGYGKLYTSQPGNIIRSGVTLAQNKDNFYQTSDYFNNYTEVNTNMVGFPITDLQYLNNNTININIVVADAVSISGMYIRNLSLVFYTFSGGTD